MVEAIRKIEDFQTREEYYMYKQKLAESALLGFGIVLPGKSPLFVRRVQDWTQEVLNLNDDDMNTARINASFSPRFTKALRIPVFLPTAEALPPTDEEQVVVDLVQKISNGVDAVHETIMPEAAELQVPHTNTAIEQVWTEKTAAFFRERDEAYNARK
jgi:hypothetical protein